MQRPFFSIATANMFPTALEAANPGKSSHCELWYGLAWVGSVPVPWMLRGKKQRHSNNLKSGQRRMHITDSNSLNAHLVDRSIKPITATNAHACFS